MSLLPFDDRDGQIWFDGTLVPWREAKVHVLTHALHYASAVFEGERAYYGTVFKLHEHSERLRRSAAILDFEIPWSVDEIDEATRAVIAANNLSDAYVRPLAWRGAEQMGVYNRGCTVHLAIAAWAEASRYGDPARMRGLRLGFADYRRPPPDCAPTASKAAGLYMICTLSRHKVVDEGYDDALMLDWRGQVAEATGANVFLVMNGELHTPTPDCFLDGITRRTVMALAERRGVRVVERAIMPEELADASEVFLSGTAAEVTPVREIGPHHYQVGALTRQLVEDYAREVRGGREPEVATDAVAVIE